MHPPLPRQSYHPIDSRKTHILVPAHIINLFCSRFKKQRMDKVEQERRRGAAQPDKVAFKNSNNNTYHHGEKKNVRISFQGLLPNSNKQNTDYMHVAGFC